MGERITDEYHEIKAQILIDRLTELQKAPEKLESLARFLSVLTGVYEEAARESATFPPNEPPPA